MDTTFLICIGLLFVFIVGILIWLIRDYRQESENEKKWRK